MTSHEDMARLEDRIDKAELDRNTWQASGQKEKYLEAYFVVEALQLQLRQALAEGTPAAREKTACVIREQQ